MDTGTVEVLLFVGDLGLTYLFYRLFKKSRVAAEMVKDAPSFEPGRELEAALKAAPEMRLPYACIEGAVKGEKVIHSRFRDNIDGVVQELTLIEHKSRRTQGFWTDAKKVIRHTVNSVPFALCNTKNSVSVNEPLSAEFFRDVYSETYHKFEPALSGFLEKGIDRLSGEVTKGYEEKESMLLIGTNLIGIGELCFDNKGVRLIPPVSGSLFILTNLSKAEVIKKLESRSSAFKVCMVLFGAVGVGLIVYMIRKWAVYLWHDFEDRQEQRTLHAIQTHRQISDQDMDNCCVICFTHPRELILLNCGHVCLCADCYATLPRPRQCPLGSPRLKECPICRQHIIRALPLYNA